MTTVVASPTYVEDAVDVCSETGCTTEVHARGLCQKHYRRALRNSSGMPRKPPGPAPDPTKPRSRHRARAPRVTRVVGGFCAQGHLLVEENVYRFPEGTKNAGKIVCKICRRNAQQRHHGREVSGDVPVGPWNRDKVQCINGHPFTEENTYVTPSGARSCRACRVESRRRREYGVPPDRFADLLEAQDGKCAICRQEFLSDRDRHIDHDHASGVTRGILCNNCNNGIGRFKDDPSLLIAAAAYLTAELPTTGG